MIGVTPASAYCGAKLVEAVGLEPAFLAAEFPGVSGHLGGLGPEVLDREWLEFHAVAFHPDTRGPLDAGEFRFRQGGRPHFNSGIKQWLGDSRGHWEGNTLVVETTNLRDVEGRNAGVFGTTEKGKMIERFTRLGPDEMDYHMTIDDPAWYTQPWTASIPMTKVKGPLFEYACHEGNYGLPNILAGHRKEEADAAAAKASGVATDQR